jgi:hypothetical protein
VTPSTTPTFQDVFHPVEPFQVRVGASRDFLPGRVPHIARFTAPDAADAAPRNPGGTHVPEAIGLVISSGFTQDDWHGSHR